MAGESVGWCSRLWTGLLGAVALLAPPGVAGRAQELTPAIEHQIDAVFQEMAGPRTPGCALSVMRDGQAVYVRGYGMANLEYDIPIDGSSIFHVASVSKQFTAFAVSLLVADGNVSWEDDIREYVPEVPDFGTTITLRHLANHTSGLRDQWDLLGMAGWRFEADVITQGDVLDITSRQTALNFPVGTEYLYSNTGFTLLAVVVERVSGQSLKQFTQERIFGPLGMTHSHFHDDHNTIVRGRAYGYAALESESYRLSIPDFDVVGATSLHTSADDMARWDLNFYTAKVGGPSVVEEMQRRGVLRSGETIDYALGLIHGTYRGSPTVGHGGADAGYRSSYVRFPELATSIAVLCNFPTSNPANLSNQVADIVLGDRFTVGVAVPSSTQASLDDQPLSSEEVARLEGFYLRDDYDTPVRVRGRDGALQVGSQRLLHQGNWEFGVFGSDAQSRFWEGPDGTTHLLGPDGKEYRRYQPIPADSVDQEEYVGRYWSEDLGVDYEVRRDGDHLVLWARKMGSRPLVPQFRDGFLSGGGVLFSRDDRGRVNGFSVSSGRVWKVRFARVDDL